MLQNVQVNKTNKNK